VKPLRLVSMAATAVALVTVISYSTFACKQDYCAGSQAPTSLGQVGGTQNYLSGSPGGGGGGLKYPCTSYGSAQAAQALSLLQSGQDICVATDTINSTIDPAYTALVTGGDLNCACYPGGPYVGCREFYTAQSTPGDPTTTFVVMRCDPTCTNNAGCP
jgi:hypothetical protein